MKLLYYITLFFLGSCASQKTFVKNNKTCLFDDPIFRINKQDMHFDSQKYDSILSEKGFIYEETDRYVLDIQSKKISLTDKSTNILKYKTYYSNDTIRQASFYTKHSSHFNIGKTYIYNKTGKIKEVIDHEKGYAICWVEAKKIIQKLAKKDIAKYHIKKFILDRIDLNEFPNAKPKWTISMKGDETYNDLDTKFYEIDGVTGALIREYTITRIYED